MLKIDKLTATQFITELDVVTYGGETAKLGAPETECINQMVYGDGNRLPPLLKLDQRYICPEAEGGIPPETLAVPKYMEESMDLRLPAQSETVRIVTSDIAKSFFGR